MFYTINPGALMPGGDRGSVGARQRPAQWPGCPSGRFTMLTTSVMTVSGST